MDTKPRTHTPVTITARDVTEEKFKRLIARIETQMKEVSLISTLIDRERPNHPAAYVVIRAWRALKEARNLLAKETE